MRWLRKAAPRTIVLTVAFAAAILFARGTGFLDSSPLPPRVGAPSPGSAPSGGLPSSSGAWYEIAFSSPAYPDDRANHHGGLEERLVALMDRSQRTLDVAVYDFDLAPVAEAMARAAKRGV